MSLNVQCAAKSADKANFHLFLFFSGDINLLIQHSSLDLKGVTDIYILTVKSLDKKCYSLSVTDCILNKGR